MEKKTLFAGETEIELFLPCTRPAAIVYTVAEGGFGASLSFSDTAVAVFNVPDWDRDLSPWPAPRVFRGGSDFSDMAAETIEKLRSSIIPAVEAQCGVPKCRAAAGYSLAGLFALYAACTSGLFTAAACASGSLWYPGFTKWLPEHTPQSLRSVYLSLGDREKLSKSPVMAEVEQRTLDTANILRSKRINCEFVLNSGGHFADPSGRLAAAIGWINKTK